jgi:hypothetical protein
MAACTAAPIEFRDTEGHGFRHGGEPADKA